RAGRERGPGRTPRPAIPAPPRARPGPGAADPAGRAPAAIPGTPPARSAGAMPAAPASVGLTGRAPGARSPALACASPRGEPPLGSPLIALLRCTAHRQVHFRECTLN